MKYIIYLVLVVAISYQHAYSMHVPPYDSRVDWKAQFTQQLILHRHKQWCSALQDIHQAAAQHKKYSLLPLFLLPTRGVNLHAVFSDVEQKSKRKKIRLIDNSTQNINIFLLWVLDSITQRGDYKSIDRNNLLLLLCFIAQHKPKSDFKNADTGINIAQCVGRIQERDLSSHVKYILHNGKMPAQSIAVCIKFMIL